jgi:hypothetical protein
LPGADHQALPGWAVLRAADGLAVGWGPAGGEWPVRRVHPAGVL